MLIACLDLRSRIALGAFRSEVPSVNQSHHPSSQETKKQATVLFVYLAINMIIWLFLRTIEVESVFARTAIPLAITVGVIMPLHTWWVHTRVR